MDKKNKNYVKENNILQLSLFNFSKKCLKKTVVEWVDQNGVKCKLTCYCDRGVPGAFEMDVYTATMKLWVEQNMPEDGVEITYAEIARELRLTPERAFASRIKKSLKKLGLARYEFEQCFIDGGSKKRTTAQFSLYDTTRLFEKKEKTALGKSKLYFPREIRKNLEFRYYQLLNMNIYISLSSGLSRRLYEYLLKRKRHQVKGVFVISEDIVCRWLPINTENTTWRRKILEKSANELIKIGFLKVYKFDKENKLYLFTYANTKHTKQVNAIAPALELYKQEPFKQEVRTDNPLFLEFVEWLNSIEGFNESRKQEILGLDQETTLAVYPEIKKRFEEDGFTVGWLYKALKERWTFVKEKDIPETLEDKKCKECKEAYENMSESNQKQFMEDLRDYVGQTLSGEELEKFLASDKIWGTWGQMLMKQY